MLLSESKAHVCLKLANVFIPRHVQAALSCGQVRVMSPKPISYWADITDVDIQMSSYGTKEGTPTAETLLGS